MDFSVDDVHALTRLMAGLDIYDGIDGGIDDGMGNGKDENIDPDSPYILVQEMMEYYDDEFSWSQERIIWK